MSDVTRGATDPLDPSAVLALAALVGREGLTPEERAVFDTAVGTADGAATYRQLGDVVAQLPPTPPEEAPVETPPSQLRRRVLAAVSREAARDARSAGRRWPASVAAAAVATLVGVGIGRATVPTPPTVPVEQVALDVAGFAVSDTELIAHTWGTELLFTFDGTTTGEVYTITVTATDGTVLEAGSFLGDGTRTVDCEMNVALLREDAAGFTVRDAAGTVVVAAELPPPPD